MLSNYLTIYFDADGSGGGTTDPPATDPPTTDPLAPPATDPPEVLVYDDWLKEQPENIKNLLEGNIKGLRSSLKAERSSNSNLSNQIKDFQGLAKEHPELKSKLEEIQNQLKGATAKTVFVTEAVKNQIVDPTIALATAREAGLLTDKKYQDGEGDLNLPKLFKKLKSDHPTLFVSTAPPRVNAGAGAGQGASGAQNPNQAVNDAIRKRAGYNQ